MKDVETCILSALLLISLFVNMLFFEENSNLETNLSSCRINHNAYVKAYDTTLKLSNYIIANPDCIVRTQSGKAIHFVYKKK